MDPTEPGALTNYVRCSKCDTQTPIVVDVGDPVKPGSYDFAGFCSGCGKPISGTSTVTVGD